MKIFLSYGHDANAPLVEKIKEYLSRDPEGNTKHEVWIDTSEIKAGNDWRDSITDGIMHSDVVLAGLSQHSTRNPGVCRDELSISIGVMGGNIKPVLLEPADVVAAPAMLSHIQWVDMSEWKQHVHEGFDSEYFKEKFKEISTMIDTPENERYNGDITRLKDKLHPISSLSRIQSLTSKQMYGRQWLYEKIEEWDKADKERIFWIVGGPGFGKSTFAANLQKSVYSGKIPAIQFVEWGKPDHSNPCNILRNLAFQLAVRYPDYMRFVLALPQLDNLINMNEHELFDILFCESTFMKIDGGHESVWFLIDALDEANDEYDNKIALTIARHIDRMPKWIKFILTSRDDSKVRFHLQKYHPQVFDLEEYVITKNSDDLEVYIKSELEKYNPSNSQVKQILEKSQGVFLYLTLCVEGFKSGEYSIDNLDELPDGLNEYYAQFFSRQFKKNLGYYKREVVPVLQAIVSSKRTLDTKFLRYVVNYSESKFYEVIGAVEHICRLYSDNQLEKITFFHSSIENWLTNYKTAGNYYVSKEDGMHLFANRYSEWLCSDNKAEENAWATYPYGLQHLSQVNKSIPSSVTFERIGNVLCELKSFSALGAFSKYHTEARDSILSYCNMLLFNNKEEDYLYLIIDLFECVKEDYIKIGVVDPETRRLKARDTVFNGSSIFHATRNAASIGFIIRECSKTYSYRSYDTVAILLRIIQVIRLYNRELCSPYDEIPSGMFYDLRDFCVMEMDDIVELLQEMKNKYASPCNIADLYGYDGELYQLALANRYPEWYSYVDKEIAEKKRLNISNALPKIQGIQLHSAPTTPMTVVLEDADKTTGKPEELIYAGNGKVLRVIGEWWRFKKENPTEVIKQLLEDNKIDEAIILAKRCLDDDSENIVSREILAQAYHIKGHNYCKKSDHSNGQKYFFSALEIYEQLSAETTKSYIEVIATLTKNIVVAYGYMRNDEEYDKYLDKLLDLYLQLQATNLDKYDKTIIDLRNHMVFRLLKKNAIDEALKVALENYQMNPKNEESIYYLSRCFFAKSYLYSTKFDYINAIVNIENAIKLQSHNLEYYSTKGIYLMNLNRTDEALSMLQHIIEIDPNFIRINPNAETLYQALKQFGLVT